VGTHGKGEVMTQVPNYQVVDMPLEEEYVDKRINEFDRSGYDLVSAFAVSPSRGQYIFKRRKVNE
jgi:hypothetical protein